MKKKLLVAVSICILTLLLIANISFAQSTISESHTINISNQNNYLKVEEKIVIKGDSDGTYKNISFWITDEASDVSISINNTQINDITKNNNRYECNISNLNLKINSPVDANMEYKLEETTSEFEKKLLRDTENIILKYNEEARYRAEELKSNSKFSVKIKIEGEQQALNIYAIVTIFLLVVLLVVFTAYYFKKQQTTKKKEITGVSKEFLTTKKSILMSILKDIEKQHRSNKITDDTYSKLKEQYKNEAVDTMKKLEDMQKEVE